MRPSGDDREDDLLPAAQRAVYEALARYPGLRRDRDEILSDALEGTRKALNTYDPAYGRSFPDWALALARWEAASGIRRRSPVGRHQYAQGVLLEDLPADRQPPRSLNQAIGDDDTLCLADVVQPAVPDPYAQADDRAFLAQLLATLPKRYAYVLCQHDLLGRSLLAIGRDLDISESRACQIRHKALRRLHAAAIEAQVTTEPSIPAPRTSPEAAAPPVLRPPEPWLLNRRDAAFLLGIDIRAFNRRVRTERIAGYLDADGQVLYAEADLARIAQHHAA